MKKIAILLSGRGSNAKSIAEECFNGNINGEIVCFGSDNSNAPGLEFAGKNKIPFFSVDYSKIIASYKNDSTSFSIPDDFNYEEIKGKITFIPAKDEEMFLKTRAKAESEMLSKMACFKPDLLVLAGFMKTLTPYFIDRFSPDSLNPKIMNIHPAILPSFPGVAGYGDTFFYGCKVGGCTVHFIDYGTDSGPVIIQKSFDILPGDGLDDIKKKGLDLEWKAYPEAVDFFTKDRLKVREISRTVSGRIEKRKIVEVL